METAASFWSMGGYASFVWPSYAIVALILLGLTFVSFRSLRNQQKRLALLEQNRESAKDGNTWS